ncbi:RagB/SusD family nutrient uptake outer membrane protein [Carboxylicivirga marina]|uniref:RagB/SusD family nutrient uptake outer membrane protein n=1 Tax=Carboxylicivirga marina TaxID=2800988 RepID=A0ABS1HJP5_9BACT|nr:RagB/SusD family nutrient uptake outer membrane protein [Carboxylicivirga marina]MBK3517498.1 RagB/SusD family nutrient uptake outer membrane protein [Carboxylicivirga marina]
MKQLTKYIPIIFMAITLVSCYDLEEKPYSFLTDDNLFQSEDDYNAAVLGAYEGLIKSDEGEFGLWKVVYPVYGWGISGTDIFNYIPNNKFSKFGNYNLTSLTDQISNVWTDSYKVINRANNIIWNAGKEGALDTQLTNKYVAEARFIRAFLYFDMVQFYGSIPIRTKPTQDIFTDHPQTKANEEDVYQLIISDLEFAETHLDEASDFGRANKWVAKGLLSKVLLTYGGYPVKNYSDNTIFEKAAAKALEVIENSGYSLNPTTEGSPDAFFEYGKMFLESGENSNEILFDIQFLGPEQGGAWGYKSINGGQRWDGNYYYQWGGTAVGSQFAMSFHDSDIRFQWSIGPYALNNNGRITKPLNNWTPAKFRPERIEEGWGNSINAPILRMADVYLLFAEAYNEAYGSPTGGSLTMNAYDAMNAVRKRAQVPLMDDAYLMADNPDGAELLYGMSFNGFDKTDANYTGRHAYYSGSAKERFREAILMERGWELCFERHRWFDLKRTNTLLNYCRNSEYLNNGKLNASTDPVDKSTFAPNQVPTAKITWKAWHSTNIQDHNIYLPLPEKELLLNPALTLEDQNEGY